MNAFHMKRRSYQALIILADMIILAGSFLIMVWIKPAEKRDYLPEHLDFFIILAVLWLFISVLGGKLHRGKVINLRTLLIRTLSTNAISISLATLLLFTFQQFGYSRMVVLGTAATATLLEIICGICYLAISRAVLQDYQPISEYLAVQKMSEHDMVGSVETEQVEKEVLKQIPDDLHDTLASEWGRELATGILNIAGGKLNGLSAIMSTATAFNIATLKEKEYSYIINLTRMNNIRNLDAFLDTVNRKVRKGGYFLACVETKNLRKQRILAKYPPVINHIFYLVDFIHFRVLPKLRVTKRLYNLFSGKGPAVISRAEALGRLSRAGFKIRNESFIKNTLYIEGQKCREPVDEGNKNYGILIALPRIGRNGEVIKVFKMRTMHPYSEYIQDYVYSLHELQEGGKFKNDFRITSWGAFCRKIWLDELPMLINLFRGEMKLVGVRPLSRQYFNLYSVELKEKRIRVKPGLIPPFYYDMPHNLEEIQESELKYLTAYEKKPFRTDLRYFFTSVFNIFFHNARSQ